MPWNKQQFARLIGQAHEQRACRFLQQQGLQPITSNYQCRHGELDLIMRDGDTLVFVEVKYRKSSSFGAPQELFHASKRRKVERAIAHYLHAQGLNPAHTAQRIDVVAITDTQVDWLQNV